MTVSSIGPRIDIRHLFAQERADLLVLLRSIADDDWWLPTICGDWSVHDVVIHLFGADVNILSGDRDRFRGSPLGPTTGDLSDWPTLVAFIDQRNDSWVSALRRMSPDLLVQVLEWTGEQLATYWPTVNLDATGLPVNWAGPDPAPVWLHVARELTERWTHQQHIRVAVERPGCAEPEMLGAVLDILARAIPYALRDIMPLETSCVELIVTGDGGGRWLAESDGKQWILVEQYNGERLAIVRTDAVSAWQAFTLGLTSTERRERMTITGDREAGFRIVDMVSIIG